MSVSTSAPAGAPPFPGAATAPAPDAVVPLTALHPVARVDLMPPEVHARRRFRRVRRRLGIAVVGTVLIAAAAAAAAWQEAATARDALAVEQARTGQLQAEAARYAEVPAVLGSIERARTSLQAAMGPEVGWYPVLDDISRSAPETVWFEQITLTALQPDAVVEDPLATPGAVATVEMTGRALDHQDVVTWLDGMADLVTWTDPVFTESTVDDPAAGDVLTFTTSARLSADARTLRFDPVRAAEAAAAEASAEGDL
jgi:Tfp pilus assembly protein PilN